MTISYCDNTGEAGQSIGDRPGLLSEPIETAQDSDTAVYNSSLYTVLVTLVPVS